MDMLIVDEDERQEGSLYTHCDGRVLHTWLLLVHRALALSISLLTLSHTLSQSPPDAHSKPEKKKVKSTREDEKREKKDFVYSLFARRG